MEENLVKFDHPVYKITHVVFIYAKATIAKAAAPTPAKTWTWRLWAPAVEPVEVVAGRVVPVPGVWAAKTFSKRYDDY